MNRLKQQKAVLDLAVEDSYGLWEVAWRFREMDPSLSADDAVASARRATMELLQSGCIVGAKVSSSGAPEVPLTQDQALAAVRENTYWAGPASDGTQLRIHASERGEQAYRSGCEGT